MYLTFQERFWFVHIPFDCMVKFQFLAQFLVDCLPHPIMSSLVLPLCVFAIFAYYVSNGCISIFLCYHLMLAIPFRYVSFRFNMISPYGVVFCFYLKRVSFSRFLFFFQVFLCEILPVCRLKYLNSCFSSYFCFLFVILVIFMFSELLQVAVISLSLLFLM